MLYTIIIHYLKPVWLKYCVRFFLRFSNIFIWNETLEYWNRRFYAWIMHRTISQTNNDSKNTNSLINSHRIEWFRCKMLIVVFIDGNFRVYFETIHHLKCDDSKTIVISKHSTIQLFAIILLIQFSQRCLFNHIQCYTYVHFQNRFDRIHIIFCEYGLILKRSKC